jgi:endonuclease/exonuclease/phosphatase (EEP) superfamily protein YafD
VLELLETSVEETIAKPSASPDVGTPPDAPVRRSRIKRLLTATVALYAVAIVALWAWMHFEGDRSWAATIFLFGPRWVCGLPLALLVPLAAVWHRRLLWPLAITAMVIVMPVMGLQLHFAGAGQPYTLRLLSCNVAQSRFHPDELAELIQSARPDIVALQEVPGVPPEIVWPDGWHVVHRDELLVASRFPIRELERLPMPYVPGKLAAIRYEVQCGNRAVQLFNLHLLSPRRGLEAVLDANQGIDFSKIPKLERILRLRDSESRLVSDWIAQFPGAKIVVGDFNMPFDSAIYRQTWSWLSNAFSTSGFGFGFTKITEKRGWSYGARIDHVLYGPPWRSVRAWIGPDIGSDHRPLLADLDQ